jgi:hypothetical protein
MSYSACDINCPSHDEVWLGGGTGYGSILLCWVKGHHKIRMKGWYNIILR